MSLGSVVRNASRSIGRLIGLPSLRSVRPPKDFCADGSLRKRRSLGPHFFGVQVAICDERGAQLTSRIEQALVDRIAVRAQLLDEGVQRDAVEDDRYEQPPLLVAQVGVY